MGYNIIKILCIFLLVTIISTEAQREGRRRTNRRKPTTEAPLPAEEPQEELNPQKQNAEPDSKQTIPDSSHKQSATDTSSAHSSEVENTKQNKPGETDTDNAKQGGQPFIVPRGTRKPRPYMRHNESIKPRPTLPTFSRKRGPKSGRRNMKKVDESTEVSYAEATTTTTKPSHGSSRSRSNSNRRNNSTDKTATPVGDSEALPPAEHTEAQPKRGYRGSQRRSSRGRYGGKKETEEAVQ